MAWADVESKIVFYDMQAGTTWNSIGRFTVSTVEAGAQLIIKDYLREIYDGNYGDGITVTNYGDRITVRITANYGELR